MRNLKKFLALVLALALAMSMMLTASAAITTNATDEYPDGDSVLDEFVVAVDVLSGMGIFKGENGNFKPTDKIMRCEVVAMMYRLCTGDVTDSQMKLYAPDAYVFNDVPKNIEGGVWYDGYLGYCVNAGIIKGYNGDFLPTQQVTGYEVLIMLLRAIGYGKNDEFTGVNYRINAAATAQSLGILDKINSTHYANQLSLASPREVVAELTFEAIQKPQVTYQLGFYNEYIGVPVTGTSVKPVPNPSLAEEIFGLTHKTNGYIIGNQDTGENATVLGTATTSWSSYAWNGTYDTDGDDINNLKVDNNMRFGDLVTGIGQLGHKIDLWYGKTGVYAWYDNATLTATVELDLDKTPSNPLSIANNEAGTLGEAAIAAGFTIRGDGTDKAVFNDFFGLSGWDQTTSASAKGLGQKDNGTGVGYTGGTFADDYTSPSNKYLLISNGDQWTNSVDVVIPLNIQSSQIVESTTTRGIASVGVIVDESSPAWDNVKFIHDNNVTQYLSSASIGTLSGTYDEYYGILNQDALTKKANVSTTKLEAYEVGIHINGTTKRNPTGTERIAVKGGNTTSTAVEDGYFLLYELTPQTGTVIFYNAAAGYVMFDDGTILNRSEYYDTVVTMYAGDASVMPLTAIPQSVAKDVGNTYVESYNPESYTFYVDWEGNYVGAERNHNGTFFYGTYLDYEQFTSSSTFTYYLTGVDENGNIDTREVQTYHGWYENQSDRTNTFAIRSTDALKVPYRDTYGQDNGTVNGLNTSDGYKGFTYNDGMLDPNTKAPITNEQDYFYNMERQGIIRGLEASSAGGTAIDNFDKFGDTTNGGTLVEDITIGNTDKLLGMAKASSNENLWLTDNTKIILVDGTGEDTLKVLVCNGITDMLNKLGYGSATIHLDYNVDEDGNYPGRWDHSNENSVPYAAMTYYKKAVMSFDQVGNTAEEITWIIMPKAAVQNTTGSSKDSTLYYMGNPNYTLISANTGSDIVYLYTLYNTSTGEAENIWLTDAPDKVYPDTFVNITETGNTVKNYNNAPSYTGSWLNSSGTYANFTASTSSNLIDGTNKIVGTGVQPDTKTDTVTFTSVGNVSGKLTGTFDWTDADGTTHDRLMNVADAIVVNLNDNTSPKSAGTDTGYVWPNVYDPATLCNAGSIAAMNQTRNLHVSALSTDGVNVSIVFVCWDQTEGTT